MPKSILHRAKFAALSGLPGEWIQKNQFQLTTIGYSPLITTKYWYILLNN